MLKPGRRRAAIPRLRHEQVAESFVDYHFGRLSPEMNIAIERHVKSCARCKREGLTNAANERKLAGRRLRGVRGGKPLIGRRGRNWIMLLLLILVMQVVIFQIANGQATSLVSLLSHSNNAQVGAPSSSPVTLTPSNVLPLNTGNASAIALAPNDTSLAVAGGDGQPNVAIWDITTDKPLKTLKWSDATPPTSIAWTADGAQLAAADGAQITIWNAASGAVVWQFTVPAAPAMRVYDVTQQVIIGRPDPATAFASGPLAWGADGSLIAAPAGALGDVGATTPQAPIVALWASAGTHIFAGSDGTAMVGSSPSDVSHGMTLFNWSPDGRYLLWGALAQPIAIGAHPSAKASVPPDSVIASLASTVAGAGAKGSVLVWIAPVGKLVAVCDQTSAAAQLQIVSISTGAVKYTAPGSCASMMAHSMAWASTGKTFYVVPAKGPVAIFTLSS